MNPLNSAACRRTTTTIVLMDGAGKQHTQGVGECCKSVVAHVQVAEPRQAPHACGQPRQPTVRQREGLQLKQTPHLLW